MTPNPRLSLLASRGMTSEPFALRNQRHRRILPARHFQGLTCVYSRRMCSAFRGDLKDNARTVLCPSGLFSSVIWVTYAVFLSFFFEMEFHSCYPGWSAMVGSRLTATSASWVQAILLPQFPQ